MAEFIAFIIFVVSSLGVVLMLYKKVPAVAQLPKQGSHGFESKLLAKVKNKIQHHHFHLFEKQMLLHRILSWVKVWTLKIETKIDHLLHGIRKKAQELDKKVKNKK